MIKQPKVIGDKKPVQWKPAKLLDSVSGLDEENYRYRWRSKDPARLQKAIAEGWEIVNTLEGDKIRHQRPDLLIDGSSISKTLTEYRELIMMRMPIELARAREQHYENLTESRVEAIESSVKEDAEKFGATIHGSIKPEARIIE